MKIVIDIEDYDREWIANCDHIPDKINRKIAEAIIDGIPLPEHHGRLVDADWVKNTLDIYVINEYNGQFIRRNDIDTIPTIIEGSDSE